MKGSRLHLDLFKTFRDLSETRSFSKAAARNFLTQSAVSQQIAFLERHFGRRLVERGRGKFSLTEAGRAFLEGARRILDAYQETVESVGRPGEPAGTVKVETVYSIGMHQLAPYVKSFMRRYPKVEVELEYSRSDRIYADVAQGVCELGIVAYPRPRSRLRVIPFKKEKLVLVCPPEHPLAGRRRVRLAELDGAGFVAFHRDIPTRKAVDELLRRAKASVKTVHEFDNIETVKRSVEVGSGVSLLPEVTVAREAAAKALACVPLTGGPYYRATGILCRRDRRLSRAAAEFVRWLAR